MQIYELRNKIKAIELNRNKYNFKMKKIDRNVCNDSK